MFEDWLFSFQGAYVTVYNRIFWRREIIVPHPFPGVNEYNSLFQSLFFQCRATVSNYNIPTKRCQL